MLSPPSFRPVGGKQNILRICLPFLTIFLQLHLSSLSCKLSTSSVSFPTSHISGTSLNNVLLGQPSFLVKRTQRSIFTLCALKVCCLFCVLMQNPLKCFTLRPKPPNTHWQHLISQIFTTHQSSFFDTATCPSNFYSNLTYAVTVTPHQLFMSAGTAFLAVSHLI